MATRSVSLLALCLLVQFPFTWTALKNLAPPASAKGQQLSRKAVGRSFAIGDFYDASSDNKVALPGNHPYKRWDLQNQTREFDYKHTSYTVDTDDTLQSKFRHLFLEASLRVNRFCLLRKMAHFITCTFLENSKYCYIWKVENQCMGQNYGFKCTAPLHVFCHIFLKELSNNDTITLSKASKTGGAMMTRCILEVSAVAT